MWETFMKGVNAGIMALGFLCCFGIAALIFLVLDAIIEKMVHNPKLKYAPPALCQCVTVR